MVAVVPVVVVAVVVVVVVVLFQVALDGLEDGVLVEVFAPEPVEELAVAVLVVVRVPKVQFYVFILFSLLASML